MRSVTIVVTAPAVPQAHQQPAVRPAGAARVAIPTRMGTCASPPTMGSHLPAGPGTRTGDQSSPGVVAQHANSPPGLCHDRPVSEEPARATWERAADWPLSCAALLFLGAYAWPILNPALPPGWLAACRALTALTWAAFAVDYAVRLVLSRRRGVFVRQNLLDLAVVALPRLRPLRLLRLLALLSVLNRYAGGSLRGKVACYVAGATSLVLLVASLAALQAERGVKGANITTFGDALWWASTTVMTVGYGDRVPGQHHRAVRGRRPHAGRDRAARGAGLTASFATWLLDQVRQVEDDAQAATRRDVALLSAQVAALQTQLERATGAPAATPGEHVGH